MRQQLLLPLLASAAFLLTVGIIAHHQGRPAAPTVQSTAAAPVVVPHPPAGSLLTARSDLPAPAQPSAPRPRSQGSPASSAGSEGVTDGPVPDPPKPLPVRLHVTSSAGTGVTLNLMNVGPEALDLKVTAADLSGGSQSTVVVNIPALTAVDITHAGLVAEHGSELTLESPGYLTQQMAVR